MQVKISSVERGDYYSSAHARGNTVNVILQRGKDFASCKGILIFEREQVDNNLFDSWVDSAIAGEEGYNAMIVKNNTTVFY